MRRPAIVILSLLLLAAITGVVWLKSRGGTISAQPPFASRTTDVMSTLVTVTAPAPVADDTAAIVFDVFREIDLKMSEWKQESPLSAVNQAAGGQPVEVPNELLRVIQRGIEIGDLTDGAFDITWAALWGVWDFKTTPPTLPDPEVIRERLELIDYQDIVIDEDEKTVHLPRKGMLIGLGGIAKGTALDRSAEALLDRGIESFLITAGGQVVARGMRGDRPWRIGIRDPRGGPDDYFARLELTNASAATSGDYERFFILDGIRYHHILDPSTGRPSMGLRSVTVVSPDAELADALSTAMMILGREKALRLAERLENVEAVLVSDAGEIHLTAGLADRLQILRAPHR